MKRNSEFEKRYKVLYNRQKELLREMKKCVDSPKKQELSLEFNKIHEESKALLNDEFARIVSS